MLFVANQTNKLLIILVSVLIILLIIAVIMFSAVLRKTDKNVKEEQTAFKDNKSNVIDIEKIEEKNEVLVAYLDGQQNSIDSNVVVIGTDKELNNNVENNTSPYYIKVNVQSNVVTIYKKDGNGKYNIPLKAMICSCGAATPVEGTYSLKKYNNWKWKTLIGKEYAQYATQISGDILFHSVPYTKKGDNTTLKYTEYDKLGEIATVGSVQLKVIDAKWIYENCPAGTQVTFYTSENAGPLGVPTLQLITEDEQVRGWDPTDPDENNPWKTYVRPEKKTEDKKEENKQENTENKTPNNNTVENTTTNNEQQTPNQNSNTNNNNNNNSNTTENNTINNNVTDNTTNQVDKNTTVENRVLEENNDVTIKSEIMDTNSLR